MAAALENRIKAAREEAGWSQAELARRAGLSRAAVSAIENKRLVPSAAAAIALARTFGTRVEALFSLGSDQDEPWAIAPFRPTEHFWRAELAGKNLRYPLEPTAIGSIAADSVARRVNDPRRTIVIAGCDPSVGLLGHELAAKHGVRLIPLERSSSEALALLAQGKVHAAGIHLGNNAEAARRSLGAGFSLVRGALWESGIAAGAGASLSSTRQMVRGTRRWVLRAQGAGARSLIDELFGEYGRNVPSDAPTARNHSGVTEIIRSGLADAGVCLKMSADSAG
ncbi:MAG: helix-turn-helix domain-containing protein, partial [Planctomycetes bacterium]|nr:helix-turn-helix domain-containing protein [Planctomycetota bacterium]